MHYTWPCKYSAIHSMACTQAKDFFFNNSVKRISNDHGVRNSFKKVPQPPPYIARVSIVLKMLPGNYMFVFHATWRLRFKKKNTVLKTKLIHV